MSVWSGQSGLGDRRLRGTWHVVPGFAFEQSASFLLIRAAPLFEKEGNAALETLVPNIGDPFCSQGSRSGTKGPANFQPAKFLAFGRDYSDVPATLAGYVYLRGPKQSNNRDSGNRLYLARVPRNKLRERTAYEFYKGADAFGIPTWDTDTLTAQPVFADSRGVTPGSITFDPGIKRFLLTCFHIGPGQLGVFDSPNAWGPWTTVAYHEDWGRMGPDDEGLTCGFNQKWMSPDGLTLWSIFSVYGKGAEIGIKAHDKFNIVKATLVPKR